MQLDAQDFVVLGAAPRAFLGWKKKILTHVFDTTRFAFAQNFFFNWIDDQQPLQDALDAAAFGTIEAFGLKKLQIWGDLQLVPQ